MSKLTRAGNHLEPKYKKLADVLISQIEQGVYGINDQIPSIKQLSKDYQLSRETVGKALSLLSEQGILESAYRQGYYVKSTNVKVGLRIFFLMDKVTEFKNRMYESFLREIGANGSVQVFFHHHNYEVFRSLILDNLKNFTHFVIVGYLQEDLAPILNLIPPEKRLILDSRIDNLEGQYAMVCQDFNSDIYYSLKKAYPRLKKYSRIILVSIRSRWGADLVIQGFTRFCNEYDLAFELTDDINAENFQRDSVYIFLSNINKKLVEAIKICRSLNYEIGKDVGIVSYNDYYVNEVLEGGITVITTDFDQMGKTAARLILDDKREIVINPSKLILRKSI